MKHSIMVSVNEDGKNTRVVKAKEQTVREKLLTALFGKKAKVLVITPYSSTNEITIKEQGGQANATKRNVQFDCC
ncbi:MAG: hypothetical protein MR773_01840 [Eubacterium coprostanoligenes]|nr:hypothetical protein [Eubacterium coprostanoligenes]